MLQREQAGSRQLKLEFTGCRVGSSPSSEANPTRHRGLSFCHLGDSLLHLVTIKNDSMVGEGQMDTGTSSNGGGGLTDQIGVNWA